MTPSDAIEFAVGIFTGAGLNPVRTYRLRDRSTGLYVGNPSDASRYLGFPMTHAKNARRYESVRAADVARERPQPYAIEEVVEFATRDVG